MTTTDSAQLRKLVGQAIARQRTGSGLKQEQVAERLGIGIEAVSRIERGIVMPNLERLVELANIFGCETADLLTEGSYRPEDQARRISELLAKIEEHDRELVLGILEQLVARLRRS